MMGIKPGLLRVLWRQARPATLLGGIGLCLYVLLYRDVMAWRDAWPLLIAGLHCLTLAGLLGRFRSPAFAYLYSRGYSRDALWGHVMVVSALSVLVAWGAAAAIVWGGARSALHDYVLASPYFPVMAPREALAPVAWGVFYLVFVPAVHYAWIRNAQPTGGRLGGTLAVVALVAAAILALDMIRYLGGWLVWLVGASLLASAIGLLWGGRVLHRSLEVRA